jgi:hypothetical protein
MAQSVSTFRLVNADSQHNFRFTVTRLDATHAEVRLEAEGVVSAMVSLAPNDDGQLTFSATGGGGNATFVADGKATWDDEHSLIRYDGFLRIVGVAEVRILGAPVAFVPAAAP